MPFLYPFLLFNLLMVCFLGHSEQTSGYTAYLSAVPCARPSFVVKGMVCHVMFLWLLTLLLPEVAP